MDIDAEIRRLTLENKQGNKIKGCLFNLLVYTKDEIRGDFLRGVVQSIVQKLPCRLITVQSLSAVNESLEIKVKQYGNGEIVCDHIAIKCPASDHAKIPFIVIPQFVPDLPVYIIWGDDPSQNFEVLKELIPYATRVIFDLESVFEFKNYCPKVTSLLKEGHEVIDIPWAVLSSWREVFSKVFSSRESLKKLQNSTEIDIYFNAIDSNIEKRSSTNALYLSAWMTSSLEWELKSVSCIKNVTCLDYDSAFGKRKIKLTPKKIDFMPQGAIVSIQVKNEPVESVELVFKRRPDRVLVHVSSEDRCFLPLSLQIRDLSKGLNFIQELLYSKTLLPYKKTMIELEKLSQKEASICEI